MKLFDCRGIIINKRDFGEADRYITIFTENFGKISVLLKGIRKSKTRERSILQSRVPRGRVGALDL